MTIHTPSRSIFRPKAGIDQSILKENKRLIDEIDRRKVLRGALSLGALTFLTGCGALVSLERPVDYPDTSQRAQ